jgi:predicted ester cyclase
MFPARFLCLALVIACTALQPAAALTLYVSPAGNDAWTGSLEQPNDAKSDGPLASLTGARDALRKLRSAGPREAANVRVVIAQGEYTLTAPLVLEPQDSGVIFEAAPGARVQFSGGRKITGFRPVSGGLWQAEVPDAGKWRFEQLWVNGRQATRARTPNADYFQAVAAASEPVAGVPLGWPLEKTAIKLRPVDL